MASEVRVKILVFGHNDWWVWERQGFCTRNAAMVRELSRRPEVDVTAVIDMPRFRTRSSRTALRSHEAVSRVASGIVAVRHDYLIPVPSRWLAGRRLNEALARHALRRRIAEALGPGGPVVLWVADPRMVEASLHYPHDLFVFDAIDDWRQHQWAGGRSVTAGYRLAARVAELVLAVNADLLGEVRGRGAAAVVANAIDPEPWRSAAPDTSAVPELQRPLVGYVGGIQSRFDVRLLRAVAARCPGMYFALAGRVSSDFVAALRDLPSNVHLLGDLPHAHIPGLIAATDACIVPHVRDGLTRSMDPLKIYEYLAAGRPVVSTVPSPNPRLAPFVRCASGAEDFAAALTSEIATDDAGRRAARSAAAGAETWSARVDQVLDLVSACLECVASPTKVARL